MSFNAAPASETIYNRTRTYDPSLAPPQLSKAFFRFSEQRFHLIASPPAAQDIIPPPVPALVSSRLSPREDASKSKNSRPRPPGISPPPSFSLGTTTTALRAGSLVCLPLVAAYLQSQLILSLILRFLQLPDLKSRVLSRSSLVPSKPTIIVSLALAYGRHFPWNSLTQSRSFSFILDPATDLNSILELQRRCPEMRLGLTN